MSVIFFVTVFVSYWGTGFIRTYTLQRNILDIPNPRSSHSQAIPRGGGLAVFLVTLAGLPVCTLLIAPGLSWPKLLIYSGAATLIAVIGWLDDLRSLSNRLRFASHSAAALLCIFGLEYWHTITVPWLGEISLGWLGIPLTLLWLVGLTNAYNFMDGIDGLAGTQAVIAGLGWGLLGWLSGQPWGYAPGLLIAGASLGFLGHNWPPARIFMGDVGSTFLGYTFAVLAVVGATGDPRLAFAGILLVWPFIFDTTFTLIRRLRRGENIFTAHRSHLYQRLIITGCSHRFVTLLYGAMAIAGVTLAWLWYRGHNSFTVVFGVLALGVVFYVFVNYMERSHLK
jgi:UDP-N-acetylmuramyl pentapeptide phosphotransferase/UDP-N-acetylglucosamine-1-phosphate transferase